MSHHIPSDWATISKYIPQYHRMSRIIFEWATISSNEPLYPHRLSHYFTKWAIISPPTEPLLHRMGHNINKISRQIPDWATKSPNEPPNHQMRHFITSCSTTILYLHFDIPSFSNQYLQRRAFGQRNSIDNKIPQICHVFTVCLMSSNVHCTLWVCTVQYL